MERELYNRCRAAFIRRELRRRKQLRLNFDGWLRMQSQCRIGELRAIKPKGQMFWTIWRDTKRGLLTPASTLEFATMEGAITYLRSQLVTL